MKFWHKELSNIQSKNIGEGCTIHSHVWIGDEVVIGRDCKIQAFAFIPNGVRIGDNVFIGPHACFTNDKHPSASGNWKQSKTLVGDHAVIGANATILPSVTIGASATIGAGAVVTKDVESGAVVVGNPAREL